MKKAGLIYLFLVTMVVAWGQNERKVIRQGLRAYKDSEFSDAEVQFRKAGQRNATQRNATQRNDNLRGVTSIS